MPYLCANFAHETTPQMILQLVLVLLEDAGDSSGTATTDSCGTENGVCDACITVDSSKPYWDGENCVSCAAGTNNANLFFDTESKTCVKECSFVHDKNNKCKTCAELDEKTPFWTGKECVSVCPSNTFADSTADVWLCVASCGERFVDDTDGYKCVNTC